MVRHLRKLSDLSKEDILKIIDEGIKIKKRPAKYADSMRREVMSMLFQKTSTRTRCSFEAGMAQMGGHAMYLDWRSTNFTLGSIADEVKCLDRYSNIIMARVYKHEDIDAMANASRVPVINALCDKHHPCQVLADLMTVREKKGKLAGLTLAYVGDGNNVCNSLIEGCTLVGMKIRVATPKGYEPIREIIDFGNKSGLLYLTNDPIDAVKGADVIYTDTWVSMGQEADTKKRVTVFSTYQVNTKLVQKIGKTDYIFMHCLPAHRGYEVSDEVLDSPNSVVFDEAENRMHVQKAIILFLLGKI